MNWFLNAGSDMSRGSSFRLIIENENTPEKVPCMLLKRSARFGTVATAVMLGVIWTSRTSDFISIKYWRNCSGAQRVGYATVIG